MSWRRTERDRLAVLLRVLEFAVERLDAALQGGFELRQVAHQDDQVRSAGVRSAEWMAAAHAAVSHSALRILHSALERPSLRLGALGFQFLHRFAAEAVQFADGQQDFPSRQFFSSPSLKGVPPRRPSCSRSRSVVRGWLLAPGQRHRGGEADHVAQLVARR